MKIRFYCDIPPGWKPTDRGGLMATSFIQGKKKPEHSRVQFDIVIPDNLINQVDGDALPDPEEATEWVPPGDATLT